MCSDRAACRRQQCYGRTGKRSSGILYSALLVVCLLTAANAPAQTPQGRPRHALRHLHSLLMRGQNANGAAAVPAFDPPEQTIGERLFLDTRFARFFAATFDGNVNHSLKQGEPVVEFTKTLTGQMLGPFAGKSINCRSCHFVDEFGDDLGNRTYADYTRRSPIPDREDGKVTTPRNSLNMVDSFISRPAGLLLHGDGEFATAEALVDSTMKGRNFGWLPTEYDTATAHIAKVIREDDGTFTQDADYGKFSYTKIFLGTASDIPPEYRLPEQYRIDVNSASDEEVSDAVNRLVAQYLFSLTFSRNANGIHDGSPYDRFLVKNNLPATPASGESESAYSARLLEAVDALSDPVYVTPADGAFETQDQKFAFGATELQGLKLFLRTTSEQAGQYRRVHFFVAWIAPTVGFLLVGFVCIRRRKYGLLSFAVIGCLCSGLMACGGNVDTRTPIVGAAHVGNCVSCHVAPNFSDFGMHNTGASQEEYDAIHGDGAFMGVVVPDYTEREANRDAYLPATPAHPNGTGRFRSPAVAADPSLADLGLWNVYANTDYPEPQQRLQSLMCAPGDSCDPEDILPLTLGRFKTPTLRDLGHSQPYMHTGRMDTIEKVLDFYRHTSLLAQDGRLRNADPEISRISIDDNDAVALSAFLRSLNEDYD